VEGYGCPVSESPAFQALAEPRRRAILMLVKDGPMSVNEIAERFDVSQQAVSQHLRVLLDAGVVDMERQGQRHLYVMRPEGLQAIGDFLSELWPQGLEQLRDTIEKRR